MLRTQTDPKLTPYGKARLYYTKGWARFRKNFLLQYPFCEHCSKEGRLYERAIDLDHILPLDQGGLAYEHSNIQGLCKRHHAMKTRREQ